jgi:hypothetical protein
MTWWRRGILSHADTPTPVSASPSLSPTVPVQPQTHSHHASRITNHAPRPTEMTHGQQLNPLDPWGPIHRSIPAVLVVVDDFLAAIQEAHHAEP